VPATLCAGIAMLCLFVWIEKRQGLNALMPLVMFQHRNFQCGALISFLQGATSLPLVNYWPLYFQNVYQDSPVISGLRLLPGEAALLGTAVGCSILLSKKVKYHLWPATGSIIELVGFIVICTLYTAQAKLPFWLQCVALTTSCLGLGLISPTINLLCTNSVSQRMLAAAESTCSFIRFLGSAAALAILSTSFNVEYQSKVKSVWSDAPMDAIDNTDAIIEHVGLNEFEHVYAQAFQFILYISAGFAGMKLLASPFVTYKPLRETVHDDDDDATTASTENSQSPDGLDSSLASDCVSIGTVELQRRAAGPQPSS